MSNRYKNLGKVAMSKAQCFICLGTEDIVVMQNRAGKDKVSQLEGKIIDYNECKKCQEYKTMGVILVSVKDNDKDYRTGGFWVIKVEAVEKWKEIFREEMVQQTIDKRIAFLTDSVCDYLGLIKGSTEPRGAENEETK